MSSSNVIDRATELRAHVDAIAAASPDAAELDEAAIRTLLTAAVRIYSQRVDREGTFAGIARDAITATDALTAASTLLKAVNVAPFELGLWEAWS
jgi:hypothetical protein